MRRILFIALILTTTLNNAFCQVDHFLLPEDFFPHKGDTLKLHLFNGNTFSKAEEQKFDAQSKMKFNLIEGSKPVDITSMAKDGNAPVITTVLQNNGVQLITATRQNTDEIDRKEFEDFLSEDGLDKISENLKQFQQSFRQRGTSCLKTLIAVDKNSGNPYEKPVKSDYEITLQQNPYKGSYGDDITGVLTFKGQPIKAAHLTLVIRSPKGTEFPQDLSTDEKGQFFFKLTREGIYLLRSVNIAASKDPDFDFDIWQTAFTFAFSSSNTMPNTYKDFGFGNMH